MKFICVICVICGLTFPSLAQVGVIDTPAIVAPVSGGGGIGGCTNELMGTSTAQIQFVYNAVQNIASSFTATCDATISNATIYLSFPNSSVGLPDSFTLTAVIYSDSGGSPGTQIGTASTPVLDTTIGTSEQAVVFTGMSASLSSGVKYWLAITISTYYTPQPAQWFCVSSPGNSVAYNDGGGWFNLQSDAGGKFILQ